MYLANLWYFTSMDFLWNRGPHSLPQLPFGGPKLVWGRYNFTKCIYWLSSWYPAASCQNTHTQYTHAQSCFPHPNRTETVAFFRLVPYQTRRQRHLGWLWKGGEPYITFSGGSHEDLKIVGLLDSGGDEPASFHQKLNRTLLAGPPSKLVELLDIRYSGARNLVQWVQTGRLLRILGGG